MSIVAQVGHITQITTKIMEELAKAMRYVGMAICASRRLGWIALGIYITKMNAPAPLALRARYKTLLEYYRGTAGYYHSREYELIRSIMEVADDYRMVLYPKEFLARLDAIDKSNLSERAKETQTELILKRANKAKAELKEFGLI